MRYCLVEDWSPETVLPEDCIYVALTQYAISQFEKHGVPYITLEDFYTSGEIRGDTDLFLNEQLDWFDTFDDYIAKLYHDAARMEIKLASLYYYWIKYAVDNIILTSKVLKKFIAATHPQKVFILCKKAASDKLEHILSFRNMESTYSLLINIACTSEGIEFERLTLAQQNESGHKNNLNRFQPLIPVLKEKFRNTRSFYYNYTNLRQPLLGSFQEKKVRIFLLQTSYFMLDFCREAKKAGFEFYVLEGSQIIQYEAFRRKIILDIDQDFKSEITTDETYYKTSAKADIEKINQWVNAQCGFDVNSVLESRFTKFSEDICSEILALIPGFLDFYRDHNIDYVATPSIWSVEDHAAIAAVRKAPKTKGVGFNHGIDAFEAKSRFFKVTRQFDFLFVSSQEEAEHERMLVKEFNQTCPVVHAAKYFRNKYSHAPAYKKRGNKNIDRGKPLVVFVPVMCVPWPQRPVELTQPFPMEYMEWHKALAEFMASRPDFHFIWKGLYQPNQTFDYMAEYIEKRNFSNITFQSGKLNRWLLVAQKVICDSPSTAFFEAIFSKVPVLSLYRPRDQRLRNNATNAYGRSLAPYSSIDEGLAQVAEFLCVAPDDYRVSIPHSQTNVPELLRSAIMRDGANPLPQLLSERLEL